MSKNRLTNVKRFTYDYVCWITSSYLMRATYFNNFSFYYFYYYGETAKVWVATK